MAARETKRLDHKTRDKIKASQIVNRLQSHILAPEDIMTVSQVNAARVLLNKVLPDLKQIELSGEVGMPVVVRKDLSGESEDT